ncbi:MAG: hypothetical protein ACI35S_06810 [Anaeroplasma sp.]
MVLACQIGIDAYDIVDTTDAQLVDHYISAGYKQVIDVNSQPTEENVDVSFTLTLNENGFYQRTWNTISNGNELVRKYTELKLKLQDTQDKLLYYSAFTSASALGIEGLDVVDYYDIKTIYEERNALNTEIRTIEQLLGDTEEMQEIIDKGIDDNDYIGNSLTRRTDLVSYYDTYIEFPSVGVENKLYVDTTNKKLYLYHDGYINVGNASDWNDIEVIDGNF